nr:glycerophosphodiester phosphodiesterase family protein [Paenibacillus baekrokdamisoli]
MTHSCVAHRGASGLAPENTMEAFREALAFPYVEWIELDVQLSSDGIPVVIHDDMLKRTTDGSGRVADFTAKQLSSLNAVSWYSKQLPAEGIPSLEEVLDATIGRCRLNIELKTYGGRYPGLEQKVVELLYKKGLQHDSVLTSFDSGALQTVRQLSKDIRTGLITDLAPWTLLTDLQRLDASFLSIGYASISSALMKTMQDANITVMAWTVNDIAMMKRLTKLDPTILICTNYPDRFGQALRELHE